MKQVLSGLDTLTEVESTESTDIAVMVTANAELVLLHPEKREELYAHIRQEIESFVPDLTTDRGRKAIATLARKVVSWKSFIGEAKAEMKKEWIEKGRKVDAEWRTVEADLDALRDQARKPLTDWETAEETRKAGARNIIDILNAAAVVPIDATVASVKATLEDIRGVDTDSLEEFAETALAAKKQAFGSLSAAIVRLEKAEADAAELVKLRAANEARELAEKEAARLAEADRQRKEQEALALEMEQARQADEKARIEQVRKDAEAAAMARAEAAAKEAREEIERKHEAELLKLKDDFDKAESVRLAEAQKVQKQQEEFAAIAKREADKLAAEHQAELDKARVEAKRIADIEAKRIAEEARLKAVADAQAEADRKLAANKQHRAALKTASKEALMERCQLTEAQAVSVVTAIIDKTIPNVEMKFS